MGNIDDGFKLGIGVTKKALKLYSDFYSSDFLIASPLGLRMVLENDADFLSSIELLIMDQVRTFILLKMSWVSCSIRYFLPHYLDRHFHDAELGSRHIFIRENPPKTIQISRGRLFEGPTLGPRRNVVIL